MQLETDRGSIHGRSTSTFFLRVRLERTDRKAGKRKDGRGIGLLGSAGWRRRGQHCATVGAILFYYASLSPFRRKTFGCLPRDNFLRYVINVYGQPRLLMLLSRLSILWFSRKEKKKKKKRRGEENVPGDKGRRGTEIAPRVNLVHDVFNLRFDSLSVTRII